MCIACFLSFRDQHFNSSAKVKKCLVFNGKKQYIHSKNDSLHKTVLYVIRYLLKCVIDELVH